MLLAFVAWYRSSTVPVDFKDHSFRLGLILTAAVALRADAGKAKI